MYENGPGKFQIAFWYKYQFSIMWLKVLFSYKSICVTLSGISLKQYADYIVTHCIYQTLYTLANSKGFQNRIKEGNMKIQIFVTKMLKSLPIPKYYSDAIMSTIASQISNLKIVFSTVYSGTDQRKHQSSASLDFVWGIHRWPGNSPHKGPVTRKMFPFDDVIMLTMFFIWLSPRH